MRGSEGARERGSESQREKKSSAGGGNGNCGGGGGTGGNRCVDWMKHVLFL